MFHLNDINNKVVNFHKPVFCESSLDEFQNVGYYCPRSPRKNKTKTNNRVSRKKYSVADYHYFKNGSTQQSNILDMINTTFI